MAHRSTLLAVIQFETHSDPKMGILTLIFSRGGWYVAAQQHMEPLSLGSLGTPLGEALVWTAPRCERRDRHSSDPHPHPRLIPGEPGVP